MILVLGGTEDSREIATALTANGYQVTVSVVTLYGQELAQKSGIKSVVAGTLTENELIKFISINKITAVVDATHPFAANITKTAYNTCKQLGVKYVRYERSETELFNNNLLTTADSFEQAIKIAATLPGPWFFTTGSKQVGEAVSSKLFPLDQLFVRVLPDPKVLTSCYELGLRAKNIIAMQGPFSYELNKATYQDLGVQTIITKDSGSIGGVPDKLKAAFELQLHVVLIKRPRLGLPQNKVAGCCEEIINLL